MVIIKGIPADQGLGREQWKTSLENGVVSEEKIDRKKQCLEIRGH